MMLNKQVANYKNGTAADIFSVNDHQLLGTISRDTFARGKDKRLHNYLDWTDWLKLVSQLPCVQRVVVKILQEAQLYSMINMIKGMEEVSVAYACLHLPTYLPIHWLPNAHLPLPTYPNPDGSSRKCGMQLPPIPQKKNGACAYTYLIKRILEKSGHLTNGRPAEIIRYHRRLRCGPARLLMASWFWPIMSTPPPSTVSEWRRW